LAEQGKGAELVQVASLPATLLAGSTSDPDVGELSTSALAQTSGGVIGRLDMEMCRIRMI